jgi:hypothetical protein
MIWCKQFYYFNIGHWLTGIPPTPPAPQRKKKAEITNGAPEYPDIFPCPRWEYPEHMGPAFHCICFADIDPGFQNVAGLLTHEW